jgi:hypothetical protein
VGKTHRENYAAPPRRRYDGPFFVTGHAVDQFRERVVPQFTTGRARVELLILAASAQRTDRRTGTGDEVWVATDGAPIRFVVRDERGSRVCLTVLPAEEELAGGD